ncbi:response regulator [Paenibacillus filicis]|uniref:Transcriptional regulatory protein n=1 Tax=Paenibacillus gyeongsangnamensis TaxID=3388067 RepID=A0ABT4QLD9_9BACL|nr:response regulator [Paenibacillus filicis]MCZ8517689.1 response regulator [Paenibacillus filicis]
MIRPSSNHPIPINVLLVEDDPMVQEVNRQFVERVAGFRIVGVASSGEEGLAMAREQHPDLMILDIFMPLMDGLETLSVIRKEQLPIDVIVISAANDMRTIRRMLQNGAVDYIMKPFKFERVKQALEQYRAMKASQEKDLSVSQQELDRLRYGGEQQPGAAPAADNAPAPTELPKGLQAVTLKQIIQFLKSSTAPLSAEEVAEGVGIARVTARRYLDYLEKNGELRLDLQYGVGRPVNRYFLSSRTD